MNELEVSGLSFCYAGSRENTLEHVSFTANSGEVTTLIGPNGAGKTTLLKSVLGLNKATGTIFINGKSIETYKLRDLSKKASYLAQENAYLPSLTVFEVVLLGRMHTLNLKVHESELEKVLHTLKILHLENLAHRPYYALSGGQRKIVNIAQAIVKEPELLILDEPTANLDMQHGLEVMDLIVAYTRSKHTTTVVTLHDLNIACKYSDRLIMLKSGLVFAQGKPEDVVNEETIRTVYGVETEVRSDPDRIPQLKLLRSVRKTIYHF